MTEGKLIIGDETKKIKIFNNDEKAKLIPMIKHKKISNKHLFRYYNSGLEYDDTSKSKKENINTLTWFEFSN